MASLFDTPEGAILARLVSIFLIGLMGLVLSVRFGRSFRDPVPATLAVAAIITLPSFQISVGFIAVSTNVVAGILGIAAAELTLATSTSVFLRSPVRTTLILLAATVILILSLLTYPGGTTLYFVPFALAIATRNFKNYKFLIKDTAIYSTPMIISMASFFIYTKIFMETSWRADLTVDYAAKLDWLWNDLGNTLFKLWLPWQGLDFRWLVIGILAIGAGLALARALLRSARASQDRDGDSDSSGPATVLALKGLVLFGAVIGSFSPFLFLGESRSSLHIMLSLQTILVALAFLAVHTSLNILAALLSKENASDTVAINGAKVCMRTLTFILAVLGAVTGHHNLMNNLVLPLTVEQSYMRARMSTLNADEPRHIHVVRPPPDSYLSSFTYSDEFGRFTGIFPQDTQFVIAMAAREIGLDLSRRQGWQITSGPSPELWDFPGPTFPSEDTFPVPANAYIIDLNKIPQHRLTP